jgi:CelD/BcsL family acetyltransferase involved in cellulose biosynthesis
MEPGSGADRGFLGGVVSHQMAWNGVHALVAPAPDHARRDDAASNVARADAIVIERASPHRLAALDDDWHDLLARADAANVFMHPTLLAAAIAAYPKRHITPLLAWQNAPGAAPRLVGLWALAAGRTLSAAPPTPNAYLATPVVDRDCLDAVLDAFFTAIVHDAGLPNIVALNAIQADGLTFAALARVVAAQGSALTEFSRRRRPVLASDLDAKTYFEQSMSGSSRKKLRQHRRRLGEKGAIESVMVTEAGAVARAFEDFLTLEASGWKGKNGTALSSQPADAQFARAMVSALAAQGEAAIHSLTLDGRPVSMQVVLRAGRSAYTWKTAYDEALHDFSPGTLLFEDYSARLLADENIDSVDSCSFDDTGYMAAWRERKEVAEVWFDARRGGSVAFEALSRFNHIYLALRARAKTIYHAHLRRTGR